MDATATAEHQQKSSIEILLDGNEITVTKQNKEVELVHVRKISMRHIQRVGRAIGKGEAEEIELYTEKPPEWVDSLTDESFEAALKEGRRLNFTQGVGWLLRQNQFMSLMSDSPEVKDLVTKVARELEQKGLALPKQ